MDANKVKSTTRAVVRDNRTSSKIATGFGIIIAWSLVFVVISTVFERVFGSAGPAIGFVVVIVGTVYIWRKFTGKKRNPPSKILSVAKKRFPDFSATATIFGAAGGGVILDEPHSYVLLFTAGGADAEVFSNREIIRSEVTQDGESVTATSRLSQAAGLVVGQVLLGPLGGLVGSLTGKKITKSTVSNIAVGITVDSATHPLWTVDFLRIRNAVKSNSTEVVAAFENANNLHALIAVVIRRADDEEKRRMLSEQVRASAIAPSALPAIGVSQRTAFAEEFLRLSKLKEQGVLTTDEFQQMKTALIASAKRDSQ